MRPIKEPVSTDEPLSPPYGIEHGMQPDSTDKGKRRAQKTKREMQPD